ncbi:MAG: PD-(D/E)XK nuclease family protein [Cyclobacteriaceae bacterium]
MQNLPFLESLALKCHQHYGTNADRLTIVFPNRRAGLFFRKYLGKLTDKPIWSPQILSLEEFILAKSDLTVADQLQSLVMLYASYKKIHKNAEAFDKFYFWGEMILKDFNDIDNYLVNTEHIFKIVRSQKELDDSFYFLPEEDQKIIKSFWSGFLPKASKTQQDFLNIWQILMELYTDFKSALKNGDLAYKGMIYREVADYIDEVGTDSNDLWFAGFNALTASEEKIIKHYLENDQTRVFWDLDEYYLKSEFQESGTFFREYQRDTLLGKTFPAEIPKNILENPKNINVTSVSLDFGQVKAVGELLSKLANEGNLNEEKTAIILPDEALLFPLLNSIPSNIEKINVTMGLPLNQSHYYSFFESLINLQFNVSNPTDGTTSYYFKHVNAFLKHEVVAKNWAEESERLFQHILDNNLIRIEYKEIPSVSPELTTLFDSKNNLSELLLFLQDMVDKIYDTAANSIDKTVLSHLDVVFKNISKTIQSHDIKLELDSFLRIFRQMGTSVKIPFTGEPLEGIQVMGVLETRNLDFENVFILSMNEGSFPSDGSNSSFIPYNIRKAFDLPTPEQHDALQSYLFYRLFQHSKNVNIYYNNISEFNHSGELSRLVKQLELESGLKIEKKSLINPVKATSIQPITINKDKEILTLLDRYIISDSNNYKRLSPSAFNTYLDCRLKFYFRYLQKINEPDEITDDLDPALFGNLMHHAMEYIYLPYVEDGKPTKVEAKDFDLLYSKVDEAIQFAFTKNRINPVSESNVDGRSIVASRVLHKFLNAILKHDQSTAPFEIVALEADEKDGYFLNLAIEVEGRKMQVALKGVVDRVDKVGNSVRILDYKSGKDERSFSTMESLFDREASNRNKAVMQVLLYCLLYLNKNGMSVDPLVPGLFNSKDILSRDFETNIKYNRKPITDFADIKEEYEEELKKMVAEIFDPKVPFDQTEDIRKCGYCPYSGICMRS